MRGRIDCGAKGRNAHDRAVNWLIRLLLLTPGLTLSGGVAWDFKELSLLQEDQRHVLSMAPLHLISIEELQAKGKISTATPLPLDSRWLRIGRRWGYPRILVGRFDASADPTRGYSAIPLEPIQVHLYRNGKEVKPTPVSDGARLHFLNETDLTSFIGFECDGAPGDDIAIEASIPPGSTIPKGILAVVPYYRHDLTMKSILVSPMIERSFFELKCAAACLFLIPGAFLALKTFRNRTTSVE